MLGPPELSEASDPESQSPSPRMRASVPSLLGKDRHTSHLRLGPSLARTRWESTSPAGQIETLRDFALAPGGLTGERRRRVQGGVECARCVCGRRSGGCEERESGEYGFGDA